MSYQLVTAPAVEPILLPDAKIALRIDAGDVSQDTRVSALITAARSFVEEDTQRSLITTEWLLQLDHFPIPADRALYGVIRLPRPPFQSITFFKYVDQNGTLQTLSPTTDYVVDSVTQGRTRVLPAYLRFWPSARWFPASVQLQWKSGYGDDGTKVPGPLLQAMYLLIGHWSENREAVTLTNALPKEVPLGYEELVAPYRDLSLTE